MQIAPNIPEQKNADAKSAFLMANPLHQGQFFNVNAETGLAFVVVAIPLEQRQVFNKKLNKTRKQMVVAIPLKQGQVFN